MAGHLASRSEEQTGAVPFLEESDVRAHPAGPRPGPTGPAAQSLALGFGCASSASISFRSDSAKSGAKCWMRGDHLDRFEVVLRTGRMDRARRHESPFLEEDERDPPGAHVDDFAARAAMRPTTRRALGAIDAREPPVLDALSGHRLESLGALERFSSLRERGKKRLRPFVGTTNQVIPVHRLALAERVRQSLPEAQLTRGDAIPAATTLGACGLSRLDGMGHGLDPTPTKRIALWNSGRDAAGGLLRHRDGLAEE